MGWWGYAKRQELSTQADFTEQPTLVEQPKLHHQPKLCGQPKLSEQATYTGLQKKDGKEGRKEAREERQ